MRYVNGKSRFQWSDLNPVYIFRALKDSAELAMLLAEINPSEEEMNKIAGKGGPLDPIEGEEYTVWIKRSARFWRTPWRTQVS